MKNKIVKLFAIIALVALLMFGEYRYIMHNQSLHYNPETYTVTATIFGHTDSYDISGQFI